MEIPAGSVLKSALAGGLASALSTSLLYPVDTMKVIANIFFIILVSLNRYDFVKLFFAHYMVHKAEWSMNALKHSLSVICSFLW